MYLCWLCHRIYNRKWVFQVHVITQWLLMPDIRMRRSFVVFSCHYIHMFNLKHQSTIFFCGRKKRKNNLPRHFLFTFLLNTSFMWTDWMNICLLTWTFTWFSISWSVLFDIIMLQVFYILRTAIAHCETNSVSLYTYRICQ